MNRFFRIALLAIVGATLLSACEGKYWDQMQNKYGWTEERMITDGWLKPRNIAPQTIYCYRTIAAPECFSEPKKSQEYRLIAVYEQADSVF